jgi:hypothetical protein
MIGRTIALACTILLFSCSNKQVVPDGILKPAVMQKVMWDVLRADAFTFDFIKRDSTKRPEAENVKLQQQVFAIHKVSKEDFYKSYNYYKEHPDLMQPILDSMISKASRDKLVNTKSRTNIIKAE